MLEDLHYSYVLNLLQPLEVARLANWIWLSRPAPWPSMFSGPFAKASLACSLKIMLWTCSGTGFTPLAWWSSFSSCSWNLTCCFSCCWCWALSWRWPTPHWSPAWIPGRSSPPCLWTAWRGEQTRATGPCGTPGIWSPCTRSVWPRGPFRPWEVVWNFCFENSSAGSLSSGIYSSKSRSLKG